MAVAISKLVRTIRLEEAAIAEVLARLDERAQPPASDRRGTQRFAFRARGCVMHLRPKGADESTAFCIHPHDISATGMSFLHGAFVYPGTRCLVQLCNLKGHQRIFEAQVMRCTFLQGNVHHVGVRFKQRIDPAEFCETVSAGIVPAVGGETTANKGPRVLVVDDDPSIVRLATALFRSLGVQADGAAGGAEAIELAAASPYALLIVDLDMPSPDGMETMKQLRAGGCAAAFVAGTGLTQPDDRRRCLAAGFDDFLAKPYDRPKLQSLLQSRRMAELVSALAGSPDMLPLVEEFLRGLPGKVSAILAAHKAGQAAELESACRALKGEAGGYGFAPISAAAENVELALRQKADASMIERWVNEVASLSRLARVRPAAAQAGLAG